MSLGLCDRHRAEGVAISRVTAENLLALTLREPSGGHCVELHGEANSSSIASIGPFGSTAC
jgi:hypothetical protein